MLIWGKEERLRLDREKTEKMLENKGLMLEMKAKEINQKIEAQKALQTEADLLFRFKSLCNVSLIFENLKVVDQRTVF